MISCVWFTESYPARDKIWR